MKNKLIWLGAIAAFSVSINANALVLDDFTIAPTDGNAFPIFPTNTILATTAVNGPIYSNVSGPAANILGGWRNTSVELIQDISVPPNSASVQMSAGGGVLAFSNSVGGGGEGVVQWDGTSTMTDLSSVNGSLGGVNLNDAGEGFGVEVLSTDGGFDIRLEAYSSLTAWTKVTIAVADTGFEFISFAAMEQALFCGHDTTTDPDSLAFLSGLLPAAVVKVECGGGGVVGSPNPAGWLTADFDNISAMQLVINVDGGAVAVDLSIGKIETVPEPASLALFGIGLLGAGFAGSRRRKNKA